MHVIFASVIDQAATPVGILFATNGALTAALGIIYKDCRKDRERLWQQIRELERKIGK